MTKLDKIKKEAIETHIPIMMDDTLDKITEIIGSRKLHRILEIGTAVGYSALCFEDLLDKDGIIDTIERDEERIAKAKSIIVESTGRFITSPLGVTANTSS